MRVSSTCAWVALPVLATVALAGPRVKVLVASGDLDDAGHALHSIREPRALESGIVFRAASDRVSFVEGSPERLLLRTGDEVLSEDGITIDEIFGLTLGAGRVLIGARTNGAGRGFFTESADGVARDATSCRGTSTIMANARGDVVSSRSGSGILCRTDGTTIEFRRTDLPGTEDVRRAYLPAINDAGQVAFLAQLRDRTAAVLRYTPGLGLERLVGEAEIPLPHDGRSPRPLPVTIDPSGAVTFVSTLGFARVSTAGEPPTVVGTFSSERDWHDPHFAAVDDETMVFVDRARGELRHADASGLETVLAAGLGPVTALPRRLPTGSRIAWAEVGRIRVLEDGVVRDVALPPTFLAREISIGLDGRVAVLSRREGLFSLRRRRRPIGLLVSGDAVPDAGTIDHLLGVAARGARLAITSELIGGERVLLAGRRETLRTRVRDGDAAPEGGTFSFADWEEDQIQHVDIDGGRVVFTADVDGRVGVHESRADGRTRTVYTVGDEGRGLEWAYHAFDPVTIRHGVAFLADADSRILVVARRGRRPRAVRTERLESLGYLAFPTRRGSGVVVVLDEPVDTETVSILIQWNGGRSRLVRRRDAARRHVSITGRPRIVGERLWALGYLADDPRLMALRDRRFRPIDLGDVARRLGAIGYVDVYDEIGAFGASPVVTMMDTATARSALIAVKTTEP